jgi:short-subunit dehydrogenase
LVLVARDESRLADLASELTEAGAKNCEVLVADLATAEGRARVAQRAAGADIDLVVNNAGFGLGEKFTNSSIENELALLDVLVGAVVEVTHSALPGMIERNRGGVINVSSVAGWMTSGSYSAAKSYVTVLSEALATQLRSSQVHVMALCPGFVRTEFHDRAQMSTSTIPNWMWLESDSLVRTALADFARGKVVSTPSIRYKALTLLATKMPRGALRRISTSTRNRPKR